MALEGKRVELKPDYAQVVGLPAGTQATVKEEHGSKELSVAFDDVMYLADSGGHIPQGQTLRTTAKAWRSLG